jgi:hypothetical protein
MNSVDLDLTLRWGSAIVITISITGLVIIYRKKIHDFIIHNITRIKIGFGEINLDKQGLKKLRDIPQVSTPKQVEAAKQVAGESADLSARDIVLNRWGSLKQIVQDIAIGRDFRLTPESKTPDVVERLLEAKLIPSDLADAILFLFEEGKKVSANPGKVDREYALIYEEIAGSLVDWMMLNILLTRQAENGDQKKVPHRRQTVVGGTDEDFYFASPRPGSPIAWLVGKGGKFQGKRFSIDKEQYRIGRNPTNDLCLEEDDYVSGSHASIKYRDNNLFLYDLNSRNGTFVNDRRITEIPCAVRKGDRLKFGNAVFEVS